MVELIHRTRTGNGLVVQGFRYLLVGAAATVVDWLLFTLLLTVAGVHYTVATSVSLVLGTMVNYLLSVRFVFNGRRFSRSIELLLVYSVNFAGLGVNLVGMVALVEILGASPFAAKAILMVVLFGWNYLIRRHLIFADEGVRVPRAVADLLSRFGLGPRRKLEVGLEQDIGS